MATATAAAAAAPAVKAVVAAPAAAAAARITPPMKLNRSGSRMRDYPQIVVSVFAVNIAMLKICPKPLYAAIAAGVEVSLTTLFYYLKTNVILLVKCCQLPCS